MKILISVIVLFFSYPLLADCYYCESEAYDAYRDAKRAYRSNDLDSCQRYAKKAYRHFSDAEYYASSCNCSEAEYEAYDGYRDAKRAYRSNDLDSCQRYAKKAYRHASYTQDYASYCN